jgi:hypothetical protein
MRRIASLTFLLTGLLLVKIPARSVLAQAPDLSGTWKLDTERSRVEATAGIIGLIRSGAPPTLHITQPANGSLIVESQINESQSRIYKPGAKTSTPVVPTGTITMTSRWEGRTLVSEGTSESASGAPSAVKEVFSTANDTQTLTVEITVGQNHSTLIYTKTQTAEACRSWPTPCKP